MLNKFFRVLLIVLLAKPVLVKAQQTTPLIIHGVQKEISLETYLNQVSDSTNYRFFYDEKLLNGISLEKEDNGRPLLDYLNESLSANGISCLVYKQKNIILVDKSKLQISDQLKNSNRNGKGENSAIVDVGDPMLAGKYKKAVLSGFITDGKTGEPLPGAVILNEDNGVGAITDQDGRYTIEIPVGHNQMRYSYVGF